MNLTDAAALQSFVVYHERLPAGRRASSAHSHSLREELIFILRGAPKVSINGVRRSLAPGDYVVFPAGTGTSHFLYNDGAEDAEYIMVASRQERDTITYTRDLPSNSLPNKRASA